MAEESTSNKILPSTIAILACVYNLLVALICQYLPHDPLYIGLSLTLYAWTGCILGLLGLIGILTHRPALLTSLSHFLILDAIVSFLARVLILQFAIESFSDQDLCAPRPTWSPGHNRHDVVTSVRWQKQNGPSSARRRRCSLVLETVDVGLVGLLLCLAVAQGSLAMNLRRFGRKMERAKKSCDLEGERRAGETYSEKAQLLDL